MGFYEILALVFAFGGTLASILGVFYTVASRRNGRETRALIRETQELIKSTHQDTQGLIQSIQESTHELIKTTQRETQELIKITQRETQELIKTIHSETQRLLERIDQRADERHREVIEAIRTLKSA